MIKRLGSAFQVYFTGDLFTPSDESDHLGLFDLFLTFTEPKFEETKQLHTNKTMLSTMGCDFELFHRAWERDEREIPNDLKGLPQPIVGYVGTISATRVDSDLREFLARENPGISIV